MRQVDDFAIAAPDQRTSDILMDLVDDELTMPIKRQGLLDMYNGVDVTQTRHYIKIDCHTSSEPEKKMILMGHKISSFYAPSTQVLLHHYFCDTNEFLNH
jgi:hypothetical protein